MEGNELKDAYAGTIAVRNEAITALDVVTASLVFEHSLDSPSRILSGRFQ